MRSYRAPEERIYVALDTTDADRARELVRRLRGHVGGFKVGLELFCSHGPELVREIRDSGEIFLDLKLHDIPNTVARAAAAVGRLGVAYFTMHTLGGEEMLRRGSESAAEAAERAGRARPRALGVTILTSHDDAALERSGIAGPCVDAVLRLAELSTTAGTAGLVCSVHEVAKLRTLFEEACLVVPGIRPATTEAVSGDDQSRTGTPARALELGADLLVVGRPITQASDPAAAASAIAAEIRAGARS